MPSDDQVQISITARTEPPTEQVGISAPCWVRYPSTDPTARIVHCDLPFQHDGDHCETETESTWPQLATGGVEPGPAAFAPMDARRAAADAFDEAHARTLDQGQITAAIADAVWHLGVAEGRRQATEGMRRVVEWGARVDRVNPVRREQVSDVIKLGEESARYAPTLWDGWVTVRRERLVGPWEPTEQAGSDRG